MLLTHLFFVDDSLLFCKANQQDCQKILDILETYRKCLGQQINTSKTTIFFSQVTLEDSEQFIKEALRVLENRQYEKYLSLPSLIGRKKKRQALSILRREFGKNYKAGKRSFCLKWLERSLLKLWFRQYHSIL